MVRMIRLDIDRQDSLTGSVCRFSYVLAKNISGREIKAGECIRMEDVRLAQHWSEIGKEVGGLLSDYPSQWAAKPHLWPKVS